MPASLGSISKKRVPLKFSLEPYGGDGEISLVYKPNAVSVKQIQKLVKENPDLVMERTVALFVLKVDSWDATDANGEPIPITQEALLDVEPWQLLDDILGAIQEDQAVDPK